MRSLTRILAPLVLTGSLAGCIVPYGGGSSAYGAFGYDAGPSTYSAYGPDYSSRYAYGPGYATAPTIRWDSPSAGTAADMAAVTTGSMATGNTTATTAVGAKAVTAVGVTGGKTATAARTAAGSMVIW